MIPEFVRGFSKAKQFLKNLMYNNMNADSFIDSDNCTGFRNFSKQQILTL